MFNFSSFELGLLMLLASFCVFTVLNRICTCIEHCVTARAIGKMYDSGLQIKSEDMEKMIDGWRKENDGN